MHLDNEYLVPIFVGCDKQNAKVAMQLRRRCGFESHFFASQFTVSQRIKFVCHRVAPFRFVFLEESLRDFSLSLPEYRCPLLIVCDPMADEFVKEHGKTLAPYMQFTDQKSLFSETEGEDH